MVWTDERWSSNRHFESCRKCTAPKRHLGCHAKCDEYEADMAKYQAIVESQQRERDFNACLSNTKRRINQYYGRKRKDEIR